MVGPLVLLLAARAAAFDPGAVFDGARGERSLPLEAPVYRLERAAPAPLADDWAAAKARFGNEAMIAALPARAPSVFSFGVIGDAEPGRFWWERLYSPGQDVFERQWLALQARSPDFVLQLGDFVSKGTAENYRGHVALLERDLRLPLLRTPGNHDRSRPNGAASKALYDAVVGPRDYFFDHAGWRFVSLDSSDRLVTAAQLAWLREALSVPGPKVLFTHVPPAYLKKAVPLASRGWEARDEEEPEADALAGGWAHDFMTGYFPDDNGEFEALVSSAPYGVKAVFMGHIHAFWAGDHRGVRYVISGGGGSPLYPAMPGYPKRRFAHTLWCEASADGALKIAVEPLAGGSFLLPDRR